jgi:glycosyltransferase involved in cell wall biosynthesis
MPSPLFTGDALYSTALLTALAATRETEITVVGASRDDCAISSSLFDMPSINFVTVPKPSDAGPLSFFSPLPRNAHWLITDPFRKALEKLLKSEWDWIVIDHARSGGFLRQVLRHRKHASICHVAHNAEGKVRPEVAKSVRDPIHRMIMRFDAWKYRRLEDRVAKAVDIIVCITDADAVYFSQFKKSVFVVPPIYLGTIRPPQIIDSSRPKSILLVGSFYWIAKQLNLARIVRDLVPSLNRNGILLEVVGNVPEDIKNLYINESPNLIFHGPVADLSGLLAKSRGGLVAEELGGGFKLKLLDYVFARVPVFGLKFAVEGTTTEEQLAMFLAEDMDRLAKTIVEKIDDLGSLNRSQSSLFELVSDRFGLEQGIDRIRRIFLGGQE